MTTRSRRLCNKRGGRHCFLRECLTLSFVQTDFASLMEFTNRQIVMTKVYYPRAWTPAFVTHFLYCFTFLLGSVLTAGEMIATRPASHLATLLFLPPLLAAIRAAIRVAAVQEALPGSREQITSQSWVYVVLPVVTPFIYVANFLNSVFTRKIRWRGVRYELVSATQTRIISY